jgi:hypothetical protein
LSTRVNQEALEIAVHGLSSSGGNTRLNQEAIMLGVNTRGNVRLNQEMLLLLVPSSLNPATIQLLGGPFQDALGDPLSNGFLIFQLQHDGLAYNTGQIVGNLSVRVPLDINGRIQGTTMGAPVYIWPNSVLLPSGGTYLVWAYDSSNRLVWDNPQVVTVVGSTSFNMNTYVPGP